MNQKRFCAGVAVIILLLCGYIASLQQTAVAAAGTCLVEVKNGAQGDVDLHEFASVQAAGEVAQALRVDGSGLLDQYPDIPAEKFDGGMDHG